MLIGIDGNEANVKNRVGVGEFAFGVIRALYQLDKKNQYRIYLKDNPLTDLPKERPGWKYCVFGPKFAWTQWRLPLKLRHERPRLDVFFSPNHYAPRFCPVPSVISIMDLWHHYHPEQFRARDLYQLKNWEAYSVKQAKRIIVISEFTKSEIIKFCKIPGDKIVVAYPGVQGFKGSRVQGFKVEEVKKKYGITGDYILYLGTLQPKKNLIRLIEAFRILNIQYPIFARNQAGLIYNIFLVIAGKKGWLYEEIFERVKKVKMEEMVIFTDFVSEEDKPALISGASCFVLPSLYEGFGIPVLEAMAIGVPVAISKTASLPEVGGEAAFYFNPENPASIAETLDKVLKLGSPERERVVELGRKQAEKFSWEKCAKIILEVLENV